MTTHALTPDFIRQQATYGRRAGSFDAACLFVDLSGFTPLTLALMQHGTEGAEVLAEVLAAVFEPLLEAVYAEGGFVAGFAGDAFKALFPLAQGAHSANLGQKAALRAAWQIRSHLAQEPIQQTRFGAFSFSGKVCAALGDVTWEIWRDAPGSSRAQNAAALFGGPGLAGCLAIDPFAAAGEVVVDPLLCDGLPANALQRSPVGVYQRIEAMDMALMAGPSANPMAVVEDRPRDGLATSAFFPPWLLTSPLQGEFRQVVTVFVNFQRSFSRSEVAEFELQLFRLLDQYDGFLGRVGQIGDKDNGNTLLLFWGAPSSSEHDVARALGFILDLQAATPVPLRAGVTTHMAYAGFVGSHRSEEYTCYGSHVNQAARQMVAATWPELWLDAESARQAGADFQTVPLGERLFKGFSEPQAIFRLVGRQLADAPEFFAGTFVGREAALHDLLQGLAPLFEGTFAGLLLVEGEAGMGKSRLVYELDERTEVLAHPPQWFLCQTDEILRQPLNPFRYWLRRYFGQRLGASVQQNRATFDAALGQICAATPERTLAEELVRVRSFLAALVDIRWEASLYEQLEPQLRFENTLDALKSLIKAESRVRPTILILEDAHLLDDESRHFLQLLTRNVESYPFAIVATQRPDPALPPLGDAGGPHMAVVLTELSDAQVASIAADLLGGAPALSLTSLVAQRANGNPFFVEQIVLYLRAEELLEAHEEGWRLTSARAAEASLLPADVRTLLTARLDQLPPLVKEVVQTASVLGREFDSRVLAAMLATQDGLESTMDQAGQRKLWSAIGDARYLFRHALLRDAAYDMQLRARLRQLHRKAAGAVRLLFAAELAPHYAELAYHYGQGEQSGEERSYSLLAGEYAADQYANDDALRFYSRALELTAESEHSERTTILLRRVETLNLLGDREQQRRDLDLLAAMSPTLSPIEQLAVQLPDAEYRRITGDYASGQATLEEALNAALELGDVERQVGCLQLLGRILWQQGHYSEAREQLHRGIELAEVAGLRKSVTHCLYDMGVSFQQEGKLRSARAFFIDAQSGFEAEGDQMGLARCTAMIGVLEDQAGDYLSARRRYATALDAADAIGWRFGTAVCLGYLCNNAFTLAEYEEAAAYNRRALALSRDLGDQSGVANCLDTEGLLQLAGGRLHLAEERCQDALTLYQEMGDTRGEAYAKTHLGLIATELGDLDRAHAYLQDAASSRLALGESASRMDSLAAIAWIAYVRGDVHEAQQIVAGISEFLQENGSDGMELPSLVYAYCATILMDQPAGSPKAETGRRLVDTALRELERRAAVIDDPEKRQKFIEAGLFHERLLALAR